jgi:nucleoside-diphosphate-sugar epimerase
VRILVTGGAGLLGSEAARRLLDAGESLFIADAFATEGDGRAARGARASALKERGASIRRVDLAEAASVRELFEEARPQVVVNAARLAPDESVEPMLLCARNAGVELLVHVSDGDLYGPAPEPGARAREDEPLAPGDDPRLLARSRDEEAVRASGLPFVIFRAFELVADDLPPGRVARDLADAVLSGRPVPLPDNEGRDLLHVLDAARAIHLALQRRPLGRTLNLGSGSAVRLGTLTEEIARHAGRSVSFTAVPPPARPPRVADMSAAWDALRFGPELPLSRIAAGLAAPRAVVPGPRRSSALEESTRTPGVSRREMFGMFRRPFSRER